MTLQEKQDILIDIYQSDMMTVFEEGMSDNEIEEQVKSLSEEEIDEALTDFIEDVLEKE